jgi:CRP/FNR family transcriptional regulator, cyclic AMP receptor protein
VIQLTVLRDVGDVVDLVDQLFNSSEKRQARVLLLMAKFGKEGVPEMSVPRLSQETLAEMVGTTRSRVLLHEPIQEARLYLTMTLAIICMSTVHS